MSEENKEKTSTATPVPVAATPVPVAKPQQAKTEKANLSDAEVDYNFQLGITEKNSQGKTKKELKEEYLARQKEQREKLEAKNSEVYGKFAKEPK